ncbi:GC-rich sequence DNA-binding factor-like protein [Hirsutella rhossiliensis]|uniref:GC-rich sequence DNA-binding factor-like protein n=1 Tax=Hirsutella rhossiliensis TaxID=111463 RepID=A0A9P8N538_9HYPO|nr:GC-rich sequence DNA-binding factor-like protein [Hirsutella rhossiliensis]KAH0967783.1 GC-rich sequence DNA-binding factor-like protein [Hirsutella rhossiliensis]
MTLPRGSHFQDLDKSIVEVADYSSSSEDNDDDYVLPGVDVADDEFRDYNPRKRRRVGGNSKEKAALGIFGSDSDEDRPGQRWKSKTLRSKGMSFVSTAVQGGENDNDDDDDDDDDDDEDDNAGVGLGFGRTARGPDWDKAGEPQFQKASDSKPSLATVKTTFDGKSVLGRGFVPSSANVPVLNESEADSTPPPRNKPQPSAFGRKGKVNAKSFGARMMAKMGYVEGTGLGKEGQGRNVIIEANLRPQGIGLGAVKEKTAQEREEEKRQARLRGENVVDSDEEEKKRRRKAKKKSLGIAGESATSTPRRRKPKYITAEELKAAAPGLHIPDAFTPILDMTGPGGRLLTSTSGVMTPKSGVPESSEVVEARKLVKRAQADLLAFSEEWKSLEERKSWLNLELKERELEMEDLRSDFKRLQSFSTLVTDELMGASDWHQIMACLRKAVDLGSINSETADIAVAAIHPLLKASDWDPLREPARFAAELKQVSILFKGSSLGHGGQPVHKWDSATAQLQGIYRPHHKATTPYESMMYKVWLPQVLAAIRDWDALTPAPMLSVLENWSDLLPPFVRAQVLDNIARKLETAVSDWNPRKKRQSHHLPHTWLFPWLPFLPAYHLDTKGTGLVADVKRKYRQLIDVWEFERGVVPGLEQWQDVLGDEWNPLIMAHVLPSMGRYLRTNFRVDPADQEPYLPVLTGILKWERMLGGAMMAEMLVQNVFPMWNAKLQEWLALEDADLGEVAEWYSWWRGMLLKDMAETKSVGGELDKGLHVMNLV